MSQNHSPPHPITVAQLLVAICILLIGVLGILLNKSYRESDQLRQDVREARERELLEPYLVYENNVLNHDDTYMYTLVNKSPYCDTLICDVSFLITDPVELAAIEEVHPRTRQDKEQASACCTTDGYFYTGYWRGKVYEFVSIFEWNVRKGSFERIPLRITGPIYGERWIKGELVVHYNGRKSPLIIGNNPDDVPVAIKASQHFSSLQMPEAR